ncbi:MAG: gas vesicle protein [Methanosarcina sp.]|nr:gas vesicle protein [Methanosarcina sp.]MDD3872761.1 gas vesicle protein [Methanosarcina sp.]MDD4522539.1 gas vesicle protein [Methanosarcina sp.]
MEIKKGQKIRNKEEKNASVKEDEIKTSSLIEELDKAILLIERITRKKVEGVVSMSREEGILKLLVEILERKSIPDTQDILSIYEMKLNSNMDIIDYSKIGMRRRCNMFIQEDI